MLTLASSFLLDLITFTTRESVADPGFPVGGGANPQGGAKIQIFPKTA